MAKSYGDLRLPGDLSESDARMMLDFIRASTPSGITDAALEDHLLTSLALHMRRAMPSN